MKVLELQGVNISLAKKQILFDVSFDVEEGDMYGFLGPNGAGKTTTMKCILNLLSPDLGNIKIFGEQGLTKEARKKIGFMPENTYLYKYLTGREFLRFNGRFFMPEGKRLENTIDELLHKIGLEHAGDKYLNAYSKGMLQRIGLAQSIINSPKILFLDEPMSGLDPIGRKMVKDLLVELRQKGTTIFFNTHILSDVESICNKVSIIYNGRIIVESKQVSEISEGVENFFMNEIEKQEVQTPIL